MLDIVLRHKFVCATGKTAMGIDRVSSEGFSLLGTNIQPCKTSRKMWLHVQISQHLCETHLKLHEGLCKQYFLYLLDLHTEEAPTLQTIISGNFRGKFMIIYRVTLLPINTASGRIFDWSGTRSTVQFFFGWKKCE